MFVIFILTLSYFYVIDTRTHKQKKKKIQTVPRYQVEPQQKPEIAYSAAWITISDY